MTPLYWAFLKRHQSKLSNNPRLKIVMAASRKQNAEKATEAEQVYETVLTKLGAGEPVLPSDFKNSRANEKR